uniref:Uncharacterized protein n=1 Tax=Arundo donax TaxID=35708 RepID=A0A0A9EEL0_ARUDO
MMSNLYYPPIYLFERVVRNNVTSACNSLFLTTE